jgi:putative ABC transport system ATP-binding protein
MCWQTADMTATTPIIAAAAAVDAVKTYGSGDAAVTALDHVSVEFAPGKFTAIMGPSGSGKSTLMHCLAGLDELTSGEVTIGDTELSTLNDRQLTELRRTQVGFIFQSFNLIPTLTAEENIVLPLTLGGRKGDRQWIDTVIDTVGLRDRLSHRPNELSGGQQPGLKFRWRDSRLHASRGRRVRPDDRHGDPRRQRSRNRRPNSVPQRRPDRARHERAHC